MQDGDRSAPIVSVIMPAFNAEPFIEQAVRSTLEQTFRDVELLLVDDGSKDGSAAKVADLKQHYGDRLIHMHTPHIGPYPARNKALARARGDLVAFLDADDWWDPDFLRRMVGALRSSGADVAYCGWQNVGSSVAEPRARPFVPPDYAAGDPVESFLEECPWPIHAALVRRSVVERLGGFSTRRFSSMDYDLWIRMLAVTRRMVRVPEVLAFYRWHGTGQISAMRWRQVLDAWHVRRDFLANCAEAAMHLPSSRRRELVDGALMEEGRGFFWRRDLAGARAVLRAAFGTGAWRARDLPMLGAAYVPEPMLRTLLRKIDERAAH